MANESVTTIREVVSRLRDLHAERVNYHVDIETPGGAREVAITDALADAIRHFEAWLWCTERGRRCILLPKRDHVHIAIDVSGEKKFREYCGVDLDGAIRSYRNGFS